MVATLIGKGGENIRSLQDELGGMHLTISQLSEMPDDVVIQGEKGMEFQDRMAYESRAWENNNRGKRGKKKRRK
jgi:hypothetical protein